MRLRGAFWNWLQAAVLIFVGKLLFRTLRKRFIEEAPNTNPYKPQRPEGFIYSVWHDAMMFPVFAGRHTDTVALVSPHHDGSQLSAGLKRLGVGLVRGSSSRQGAAALRELIRLPATTHIVLTPDGPRGPRRQIKPGLLFLASRSGRAIVPTGFASSRSWRIPGSWTDLVVPKPFTTVYALGGAPIRIPADANAEQLAAFQVRVQAEMDRLAEEAERLAGSGAAPAPPQAKAA